MKIVTLLENTTMKEELKPAHGLSFYIETNGLHLLFDVGPDSSFWQNATQMGIDLALVDAVVISHGHNDHGGGLSYFLEHNQRANVYLHPTALQHFYACALGKQNEISLPAELKEHPRVVLTGDSFTITENLQLFAGVTERQCFSHANDTLFVQGPAGLQQDSFQHEQNLLVREGGKQILFSGCAHCGVLNILQKAEAAYGKIDGMIGGFHLYNPTLQQVEEKTLVQEIARQLQQRPTKFYSCHCTGQLPYQWLKEILGDQISHLATGMTLEV